ncbi:MAG: type I glyceraldehyde-3-phosphate dehydrogenase [Planctomycetota bacterium]|nr:MAG: type I glyceraldehyde-3-phosphate dehydrogenase [Planctomycetota bacterium]
MRIGINGYGRMGRLFLRAAARFPELELVHVNEPKGSDETLALITEFDSVQGRFASPCSSPAKGRLRIGEQELRRTAATSPAEIDWAASGVQLVVEASGRFRSTALLQPHFENGAQRVLVSAPVKDGPPNIVVGVNDQGVDFASERILTAASCTTNCLAPVVRVLHDSFGIERGVVTTIHDPTNTQVVHDLPQSDPRRSRAAQINLIPTTTNSATAVTLIVPELAGKLDSIAVRAPVLNASLTDCAFHVARDCSPEEVNAALKAASDCAPLRGILGYEERPLVSSDFAGDPRSGIVDALSTRVVDRRLVKVMAWYDNEWGYANRLAELALRIAQAAV